MIIADVNAREILDSRGYPTVEAEVWINDDISERSFMGRAAVPSGASTGSHEAWELRDDGLPFGGKGVTAAVDNVNGEIRAALVGQSADQQREVDERLIELDGTENKSRLGANAMLAASLATARAAAEAQRLPLFRWFGVLAESPDPALLPLPMMNIVNGGKHAAGSTDIQEFMIMPVGAENFRHGVRMGAEIFHSLGKVLSQEGYGTTVGDEGGYAPSVEHGNAEALELIGAATEKAGYSLGEDVVLALDVAATELHRSGDYHLRTERKNLSAEGMIAFYEKLARRFPIASIEDGLAEDDWAGWQKLTARLGANTQLVGDDLLVTNTEFLQRGIAQKAGNAILIKVNQIGTLTETIDAVQMAQSAGWNTIISHRSGETEDTTIAHLAVGLGAGQIKTGSLSRGERTAKYNELLRIEEGLGSQARFAGRLALTH